MEKWSKFNQECNPKMFAKFIIILKFLLIQIF
jgi:hypothetical protein